jgi:predicted nucleic acid-binding protein
MTGDVLVDSNIIVYTYDTRDPAKRSRAREALERLVVAGRLRLSTQVLGEVFRVITSRLRPRIPAHEAVEHVALMVATTPVLAVTARITLEAVLAVRDHGLGYWDAQLWATAKVNGIGTILTEDIPHARGVEPVEYVNPFG